MLSYVFFKHLIYFAVSDDSGPTIEEVVDPPSSSHNSNSKTEDQVELKGKLMLRRQWFRGFDTVIFCLYLTCFRCVLCQTYQLI